MLLKMQPQQVYQWEEESLLWEISLKHWFFNFPNVLLNCDISSDSTPIWVPSPSIFEKDSLPPPVAFVNVPNNLCLSHFESQGTPNDSISQYQFEDEDSLSYLHEDDDDEDNNGSMLDVPPIYLFLVAEKRLMLLNFIPNNAPVPLLSQQKAQCDSDSNKDIYEGLESTF